MLGPRNELAINHVHGFNFGARARRTARNYENYRNQIGGGCVQSGAENMEEDEHESGVCTPPLWKTSPGNSFRYLSSSSRTQAIARGHLELMEMIKNMPESTYELSLKDLVEYPRDETLDEKCLLEDNLSENQPEQVIKRQESKEKEKKSQVTRSENIHSGGLLLKMVFPVSLGSRKKNPPIRTCSRVSPKPEALDKSLKKGFSVPREGQSKTNSKIRKKSGCSPGCWPFLFRKHKPDAK
ncbi:hypothetical protein NMG60_11031818 [Bertholletia excelsa]